MGRNTWKPIPRKKTIPIDRPCRTNEQGVSEVFGAIVLIGIVTVCVTIVGTYYITRPPMELSPAVKITVTNVTGPLQIYHSGGDSLVYSRLRIFYNGQNATSLFNTTGNTQNWVVGDILTYTGTAAPQKVSIYYEGNSQSYLLFSTEDIPAATP